MSNPVSTIAPVKNVRINLAATVRFEYSEVLSVPATMTDSELNALVDQRYEEVSANRYTQDPDYWERSSSCRFEIADDELDAAEIKNAGNFTSSAPPVIAANVYSDDHFVDISFDAVSWFQQADNKAIIDLADARWGGGYPAAAVAAFYEGSKEFKNDDICTMFRYLSNKKGQIGFECHIDEGDALRWLEEHRPRVYEEIQSSRCWTPSPQ